MSGIIDPELLWLIGGPIDVLRMFHIGQNVCSTMNDKDRDMNVGHQFLRTRYARYQPVRWQTIACSKVSIIPLCKHTVQHQGIEPIIPGSHIHQSSGTHAHAQAPYPIASTIGIQPIQGSLKIQHLLPPNGSRPLLARTVTAKV